MALLPRPALIVVEILLRRPALIVVFAKFYLKIPRLLSRDVGSCEIDQDDKRLQRLKLCD